MHRLIGFALILAGGIGIGYQSAWELQKRLQNLQEIQRICQMLLSEITYSASPLPYAFLEIAGKCEEQEKKWLMQLAHELLKAESEPFQAVWEQETKRYAKETCLRTQDIESLRKLGSYMGYLDTQMQKNAILLFLEEWEEKILQARRQMEGKRRILLCVGGMGSLLLIIILW